MAESKKSNGNRKQMSEDRFTAQASNISNLRWADGYGPNAKKSKKKGK